MNNPSAFPDPHNNYHQQGGMTLRDYFAAAALQALVSSTLAIKAAIELDGSNPRYETALASYRIADAMLKAREK